jgi:hypothetical protein
MGRRIDVLREPGRAKGEYYVSWSKPNLASAAYYARLYVDGMKSTTIGIVKTN